MPDILAYCAYRDRVRDDMWMFLTLCALTHSLYPHGGHPDKIGIMSVFSGYGIADKFPESRVWNTVQPDIGIWPYQGVKMVQPHL
jgi:hypothetical protein